MNKRIFLLLAVVLLTLGGVCRAQKVKMRIPKISLGRIPRQTYEDGKVVPTLTTRNKVLYNSMLLADVNNCPVVSYKFSMIAPGKGFYGPVYVTGAELTDSLVRKIKSQDGPDVKIYIEDIKMKYRGTTLMDANPVYLKYDE